ncbi:methylated-DNA--[protein]-cysteine S-methyltransferase [Streptomyces niveiscabiei]|uniref:methylated-DNA--[protein]-cysteine S-methyltransferase n=1 Tax=Streptomyces niveiscabiei TaxID=164115 RepID=UPI0029B82CEA|nr:methylated-DNA--[protein]-cysteine S-methyltransferase [Streptomyces niveiscabiei]MDX3381800.1 methylated-DNA--[protein]-cysteine S-methyltransferase [Streptomyces niveiscabiei]
MQTSHPAVSGGVALTGRTTPLGELRLAATDDALVYCGFQDRAAVRERILRAGLRETPAGAWTRAQTELFEEAGRQIDAYLTGARREFELPVDLVLATPFCAETVRALHSVVPYGSTATYGELARALSRPRAARAVGTALGANPLCVLLPCHRIVASSGRSEGYAGGPAAKRYLLRLERSREELPAP